jgi:predicted nucleic acid-binding protein
VPDAKATVGLLDTSVVIGLDRIAPHTLPEQLAIAAITLAELAAGPHATYDTSERARRQQRLQIAESTFDPLPFDAACARAYGLVYAETTRAGRKARGSRVVDLLIAATALSAGLPLYTANPEDFAALEQLVDVKAVEQQPAS